MAWTADFTQDTDTKGVGTVTATFVDNADKVICTVSRRGVKTENAASLTVFADECKAILTKTQADNVDHDKWKNFVEGALNA